MGPGFESQRGHKTNAGLSQYIGDCSCPVQVGLTSSESIQLETMYMSKGQIWVWFDSPDGTKFFDLLYLNGPGSVKASTSHLHCDRGVRIPPVSTKQVKLSYI